MRERDTPQRETDMNLIAIEYKLEDYELPDHLYLTGSLDIEIDCVDGSPYIWAFQLNVHNGETGITVEHFYQQGRKDNWLSSIDILRELHRDKKLMDLIWEECAHEGMWD
jgi:hypothetical protein